MTRVTSARIAGFTFLFYIAVAFPSIVLMTRATRAEGTAAQLARIAEHATEVRLSIFLALLSCFAAIILAVTLYGITRDQDHELAMLIMWFPMLAFEIPLGFWLLIKGVAAPAATAGAAGNR